VHEVISDGGKEKMTTAVRVVAGSHHVKTDDSSNGIFQQPLHIFVEQGCKTIQVEWVDSSGRVLGVKSLDVKNDVLATAGLGEERFYSMKKKAKNVLNPRIKLTLGVSTDQDADQCIAGCSNDLGDLVRLQLAKARGAGQLTQGDDLSEIQLLKQACAGPLEVFEGLGQTHSMYAAMVGPPTSRRWFLGLWQDKTTFESGDHPNTEVDLMRIESVQADPTRHHVFIVNYYDACRVRRILTFRRVDRARDVWVEMLRLMVQQVRDMHDSRKTARSSAGSRQPTVRGGKQRTSD